MESKLILSYYNHALQDREPVNRYSEVGVLDGLSRAEVSEAFEVLRRHFDSKVIHDNRTLPYGYGQMVYLGRLASWLPRLRGGSWFTELRPLWKGRAWQVYWYIHDRRWRRHGR